MKYDISGVIYYENRILIVNSSSTVLFFNIELIENPLNKKLSVRWKKYFEIDSIGFVESVRGSNRFQLITDKYIHFYIFDENSDIPRLENAIFNFMGCSSMVIDKNSSICFTYKQN